MSEVATRPMSEQLSLFEKRDSGSGRIINVASVPQRSPFRRRLIESCYAIPYDYSGIARIPILHGMYTGTGDKAPAGRDSPRKSRTHPSPLDDVPTDEAECLAQMSTMDDAALWPITHVTLSERQQEALHALLDRQNAGELTPDDAVRLQALLEEYSRLLVRQAHAWLLLARRGYHVPIQQPAK